MAPNGMITSFFGPVGKFMDTLYVYFGFVTSSRYRKCKESAIWEMW